MSTTETVYCENCFHDWTTAHPMRTRCDFCHCPVVVVLEDVPDTLTRGTTSGRSLRCKNEIEQRGHRKKSRRANLKLSELETPKKKRARNDFVDLTMGDDFRENHNVVDLSIADNNNDYDKKLSSNCIHGPIKTLRQILQDEALARALQAVENDNAASSASGPEPTRFPCVLIISHAADAAQSAQFEQVNRAIDLNNANSRELL